jgi:hypothetical protein
MGLKLGTPCEIFTSDGGRLKWATTHPNTEPNKLNNYLQDLSARWHVGAPARMVIIKRRNPEEEQ